MLPAHLPAGAETPAFELDSVPFFPQQRYQCGPAALATVLVDAGVDTDADALVPEVYLPGREGSLQVGLDALPVWHFAVVVGYLPAQDLVVLRSGTERRHGAPAGAFLQTWERAGRWAMVTLPPGELPAAPERRRYVEAAAAMEGVSSPPAVLAAWEAALARWPADPTTRFGHAAALAAAGEHDEAERAYLGLLAIEPAHAPALNNLALLLAARGCHEAAVRALDDASAVAGSDIVRSALRETRQEVAALREAGDGTSACTGTPAALAGH